MKQEDNRADINHCLFVRGGRASRARGTGDDGRIEGSGGGF